MQTETIPLANEVPAQETTPVETIDIHANGSPADWIPHLDLDAVL